MKYMTFNSSCSYAGVANLLELQGVDVTDRELALRMDLPYLFAREEDGYCAGPMLQSGLWFDLALLPLGFRLTEQQMGRDEVYPFLRTAGPTMLGLRVTPKSKHAVIFIGIDGERCRFLNNKRADSPELDELLLSEAELAERLDGQVMLARLTPAEPEPVDLAPALERSAAVLAELREEIRAFCGATRTPDQLRQAMNRLFRPILLDGVTMLELLGEENIRSWLTAVQGQLLALVRAGEEARPDAHMDLPLLDGAIGDYIALIKRRLVR